MKNRPTGINGFGGGISWERYVTSNDRFKHLLLFLESKRILTNPTEMEIADWCVRSVLEIKETLVSITKDIEFSEKEINIIRNMIDACNEYLDLVNPKCDSGIIYKNGNSWADASFDAAMKGFRKAFRDSISEVETNYNIKFKKIIPEEF